MNLLTSDKLNNYLSDIDKQAEDMFFRMVKEMAENQGVTEQLRNLFFNEYKRQLENVATTS